VIWVDMDFSIQEPYIEMKTLTKNLKYQDYSFRGSLLDLQHILHTTCSGCYGLHATTATNLIFATYLLYMLF
jgi:hypothetical protein